MKSKLFVIVLLLVVVMFTFFPLCSISNAVSITEKKQSYNPSFLLLSNWKNSSILIITGISIPNSSLNGIQSYPASIRNIYIGRYGILNLTLNFNISTMGAYLTLSNTVELVGKEANVTIMMPPYTPFILLMIRTKKSINITLVSNFNIKAIKKDHALIYANPSVYLYTNGSEKIEKKELLIKFGRGVYYLEIDLGSASFKKASALLKENNLYVEKWLKRSRIPKSLTGSLLNEYYTSLLLLKDDQNPYLGTFAASPSPIYLYSWVRDSIFSAIAMQDSGHIKSALRFWLWLVNSKQLKDGLWYTRYSFYSGKPDTSFGIPELDSMGLFEIGIYNYYKVTGNRSFLLDVLPRLNSTISYQIRCIKDSRFHLIPEDLSVWENTKAYHFWTEALNDIGLYDASKVYRVLGLNYSEILYYENMLNKTIINDFWYKGFFASTLGVSVLYENGTATASLSPEPPLIDSSTLLPIDEGYLPIASNYSLSNFRVVEKRLSVAGGLARFPNDLYHYSEYLYDSSAPSPPWVITTLFAAIYYEKAGNYSTALKLLNWAYDHSQHLLLPEAVDPKFGNPLPTTSPLTWSSAMFVIAALDLGLPQYSPSYNPYWILYVATPAIAVAVLVALFFRRKRLTSKQ